MSINQNFINSLRCPKDHQDLELVKNTIKCSQGHSYHLDESVLLLETEYKIDPQDQWDKKLRDPNENLRLDQTDSPMAKEDSRQRMEAMIDFVVNSIPDSENISLLDIVTGRGLLIRRILSKLTFSTVFLNDIDANVLVGTNKLLQPNKNSNQIVPLQSSGSNLPIKDETIDIITSFGPNNIKETLTAFKECYRVLKPGGIYVFSISLVESHSPSHKWLEENQSPVSKFNLIDNWEEDIKRTGFELQTTEVLFDGPVNKVKLDTLPRVDGERFQDIGIILKKVK